MGVAVADVWGTVADVLAPPERLRPSEWAERYRRLKRGTAAQSGAFHPWPWQRAWLDAILEHPEKQGMLLQKCSQIGGSEAVVSLCGWLFDERPGPLLYLLPTDRDAREFEKDRFRYMIETAPVLRSKFFLGREHHETMDSKEFAGGRLRIYGHGSPTKLKAHPYRYVMIDELNEMAEFPGQGSAFEMARERSATYRDSWLVGWSTPTLEDEHITPLMEALTDQRRFFVPCPHCGEMQWLKFAQVRYEERKAETARYECEACMKTITDAERAAAVYKGEYKPTISAEEAESKPFVGFYISRLYDPSVRLVDVVERYLACVGEGDLQVFYNHVLGEAYTPASRPVTAEDIQVRQNHAPNDQPPATTRFITAGIDVQKNEGFFVDVSAWLPGGRKWLVVYPKLQGYEQLAAFLRGFRVKCGDKELGINMAAIDCEWPAQEVYEFCRGMGAKLLPVRYGTVESGELCQPRDSKMGRIRYYKLARAAWLDRALARFAGDPEFRGVDLPAGISNEYMQHILANVRIETIGQFGTRKLTWIKDKQARDDYLHAAVYAEFAAWMLGLDRLIHDAAEAARGRKKALRERRPEVGEEGFIRRKYIKAKRGGGGWIRR